jgi:hypothetical protein
MIQNPVERAKARAKAARMYARQTTLPGQFVVRSRSKGFDHILSVIENQVVNCTGCPSFLHRGVCIHTGSVLNRLARIQKYGRPISHATLARWSDPLRA